MRCAKVTCSVSKEGNREYTLSILMQFFLLFSLVNPLFVRYVYHVDCHLDYFISHSPNYENYVIKIIITMENELSLYSRPQRWNLETCANRVFQVLSNLSNPATF